MVEYPTYRTAEEAQRGSEQFRERIVQALGWNPWMPGSHSAHKQLERWHWWVDCEIPGCYRCLWWDICWALAEMRIYVVPPEQS